jgi:uncharacterized caspase-like protein
MRPRAALLTLVLLTLALLALTADRLREAASQESPSREPFSLEIPQLRLSGITSLELKIATTQIHTLRLHIAEPFADQIGYEKIYTVLNAESANTIQTVTSGLAGKIVTLDLEQRERFHLHPGKNVVEISATGANRQQYYASFVIIAGSNDSQRSAGATAPAISYQFGGRKYAVVVGVSKYKFHEGGLNDLRYADADARSISDFLRTRQGFADDELELLQNENATVENVRAALNMFLRRARENDLIFVFIASHGAQDRFDPKNLYLILQDTKVSDMPNTALKMSELQDLFSNRLRARQLVMVIDACHSAAIGSQQAGSTRQLERKENNTFSLYIEKGFNQEGRALLTSSDVNEVSEEGANWGGGHGVFTWAVLRGLEGAADANHDRVVTTGELFDFVSDSVRAETSQRQNPRALPGTNRAFPLARVNK